MPKTYAQIREQIEALQREAELLRREELEGVVARILETIELYGLTSEDLGFVVPRKASRFGDEECFSREGCWGRCQISRCARQYVGRARTSPAVAARRVSRRS